MGNDKKSSAENDSDHLKEVADGAGCTEIWETLSEHRAASSTDAEKNQEE